MCQKSIQHQALVPIARATLDFLVGERDIWLFYLEDELWRFGRP